VPFGAWQNAGVQRVVITGVGILTAGGLTEGTWQALMEGRSPATSMTVDGVGDVVVMRAADPDADGRFGRRDARRMDRAGQLAAAAAGDALEDAGPLGVANERVGAAVGCAHGGAETQDAAFRALLERGGDRVSPLSVPLGLPNTAAAATTRAHRLRGPSAAPATACAAGTDAIGLALGVVRAGRADAMVAGGAEAPLAPVVIAGYGRAGALGGTADAPEAASRPFDRGRDGFVIAEGAGMLVLEERERALARGATPYAEIIGYGASCDAGHLTDPDASGQGPALAIAAALADAEVDPEQIAYVNAHATSTPSGDLAEARALVAAGLGHAAVSSTKSMHGHTLGAAGGIEAALTCLAMGRGVLPPTVNLAEPEPEPALDHLREPREAAVDFAVSTSFGFGGHNACLVLARA